MPPIAVKSANMVYAKAYSPMTILGENYGFPSHYRLTKNKSRHDIFKKFYFFLRYLNKYYYLCIFKHVWSKQAKNVDCRLIIY